MRPKTKFLTVVWGEAYIRRFATLSLPSFVAPGNLPALAAVTDLEVVIMTRKADFEHFESHAAFRRLCSICPVRLVEIDDLITTGVYGVTLTLAYARPVIACGADMLTTHFVFMNADFVLADGSLRALSKHIRDGRSIVLGPSFRATAEEVEPALEAAVDQASGVLAIPPRKLAAISLPYPHPTTTAKIVNQEFCHSSHPNQFFWRVDEGTLLGRYYLIFMLCLRPERVVESINCYCDYAFIPEMCPSGDEVAMGDSDEFFMLELQRREQEMYMLRLGRQTEREAARSLSDWTTAEHRRAAQYDVVFHVDEVPPNIERSRFEAQTFVERIDAALAAPIPHEAHHYWIHGVQAWQHLRRTQGISTTPRELENRPTRNRRLRASRLLPHVDLTALKQWVWTTAYAARDLIFGRSPNVTLLHPGWLDDRHLVDTFGKLRPEPGARMLIVTDEQNMMDNLPNVDDAIEFASLYSVLEESSEFVQRNQRPFTHVLIYLVRSQCRHARVLVERCQAMMGYQGVCQVFIHHRRGEAEDANFSNELVAYVDDILGWRVGNITCTFVGGSLKRKIQRFDTALGRQFARFGFWGLLWIAPLLGASIPLVVATNLWLKLTYPRRTFVPYCSSASIRYELASVDSTIRASD